MFFLSSQLQKVSVVSHQQFRFGVSFKYKEKVSAGFAKLGRRARARPYSKFLLKHKWVICLRHFDDEMHD